jgi:hypothetical protein
MPRPQAQWGFALIPVALALSGFGGQALFTHYWIRQGLNANGAHPLHPILAVPLVLLGGICAARAVYGIGSNWLPELAWSTYVHQYKREIMLHALGVAIVMIGMLFAIQGWTQNAVHHGSEFDQEAFDKAASAAVILCICPFIVVGLLLTAADLSRQAVEAEFNEAQRPTPDDVANSW